MTGGVYLRPLLIGAAQGFEQFDLIVRDADGHAVTRRIARVDAAEAFAALPDALAADAVAQWQALSRKHEALDWRGGSIALEPAVVMGILNVTPDSFSDGEVHFGKAAADHGAAMQAAGARIIDIGGESTRPGAAPVSCGEELRRVVPVVERIAADGGVVSIDTRNSEVMAAALAAGAAIVNDVSALRHDPRSLDVVARAGVLVMLMHAPGEGSDLHAGGAYRDVALDVFDFLRERRDAAIAGGIDPARIILDPGIGYGKSLADNLALMRSLPMFGALGCPVLVGASRKRMIEAVAGPAPVDRRLGGSLALALAALDGGAQILRVHDVAETIQAAAVWRALRMKP